jgi:hypothetical protein
VEKSFFKKSKMAAQTNFCIPAAILDFLLNRNAIILFVITKFVQEISAQNKSDNIPRYDFDA